MNSKVLIEYLYIKMLVNGEKKKGKGQISFPLVDTSTSSYFIP